MTAAIVLHSVLQLTAVLVVVSAFGLVLLVGLCAAHDTYVEWRNPHGIPPAQPPRREPPRRLDQWHAVPVLGFFLTHGHPNGWIIAVPFAVVVLIWNAAPVVRRKIRRRRWLNKIRDARNSGEITAEEATRYSEVGYPR